MSPFSRHSPSAAPYHMRVFASIEESRRAAATFGEPSRRLRHTSLADTPFIGHDAYQP